MMILLGALKPIHQGNSFHGQETTRILTGREFYFSPQSASIQLVTLIEFLTLSTQNINKNDPFFKISSNIKSITLKVTLILMKTKNI